MNDPGYPAVTLADDSHSSAAFLGGSLAGFSAEYRNPYLALWQRHKSASIGPWSHIGRRIDKGSRFRPRYQCDRCNEPQCCAYRIGLVKLAGLLRGGIDAGLLMEFIKGSDAGLDHGLGN